jgi:mono/diheme cytochrome c family protein
VTEVPEHLLKRSRDRRAALGLGGGDATASGETESAGAEVEPSAGESAATAAAAPAAVTPAEVEVKPPEPPPPFVEAALRRKRIPFWAMPVVGLLPIWIILYAGSLSPAATGGPTQLTLGAEVFATKCASCHGAGGGGGVGRPLSGGEVLKTFPNLADQLEFVAHGTDGAGVGSPYGDPNREGGPHIAGSFNGNKMPAFLESLTPEELLAVVRHERETLSGEEVPAEEVGPNETRLWPNGNPIFTEGGTELTDPDGNPLLDPDTGNLLVEIAGGSPAPAGQ